VQISYTLRFENRALLPIPHMPHIDSNMGTVTEIESALEKLPEESQRQVAAWLEAKLWPETPAMYAAIDEAERSLVEEGGVTLEDARQNIRQWITE